MYRVTRDHVAGFAEMCNRLGKWGQNLMTGWDVFHNDGRDQNHRIRQYNNTRPVTI
jgi:hypothetical protein